EARTFARGDEPGPFRPSSRPCWRSRSPTCAVTSRTDSSRGPLTAAPSPPPAATMSRASRRAEHLHRRRVEQLVSQAATVLAADLARSPLDLAYDPEQAASPAPFEAERG